ncbi:conserved hypothetical protein [Chloroherpeton thalassium ATCC 35110]|uniref:Lipoprotein n=1 Tax=Chloroherpeton thalassium (strain ATCC 35110 / GB-78) TaxID=517418 RepID=B3QX39_CHLT3|nr:hypothetical protein [Chloroherpeton thalassium]ACF14849.1 conserved hypothetical protein [Chloroherpeton thalassium ATCC 35110]
MRNSILMLLFIALIATGCGGSNQSMQSAETGDIPDWYVNVPNDPNYLYSPNTQVSQDFQLAVDKASTGARSEIGRQLEVKLKSLQKKFTEETGTGSDAQLLQLFSQAEKTVVSTTLSGSKVKYVKRVKDGNMWRAYVLVEYPIGAANEAFMEQVKKNNQMYTRFRATKAFEELEEEVKQYEEFKKEQSN